MLDLLCAIVRDEPFQWPDIDDSDAGRLYEVAREHGIHLLIAERIWQRGQLNDCRVMLRDRLASALRNQLAVEEIARQELRSVLSAMAGAGLAPLLFKGTALAFTHYPDPALRPRIDTDLMIDTSQIHSAGAILERLGYRPHPFTSGELVMYQTPYSKSDGRGVRHTIDVHWKISNPQVFASAFPIEELRMHAVRLPALGPAAHAVGSVHALMLACIHRVAHHGDEERLIWIYDIHLVAERLSATEQKEFVDLAEAKQLAMVCADGLAVAQQTFRGDGTASVLARLNPQATSRREHSGIYVTRKMRKVDVLLSDLTVLQGWGPRMKLLIEHLFPPPSYIRQLYGVSNGALLPLFYLWRIARGATEWWRHSRPRPHQP